MLLERRSILARRAHKAGSHQVLSSIERNTFFLKHRSGLLTQRYVVYLWIINIDMKLFVAGLPYDLFDDELVEIFEKFGTIASAKVALDKETGKSRGFAFVDMPNEAEARDAIENLNDISLGTKPLVVKEADERSSGPGGGSRGGGGYKGGGGGYKGGGGGNSGGYNKGNNFKPRNRF
jgi:RNA recognition motif-containing protein